MRVAPLLAAGTLALHELSGAATGQSLTGHGHSYLPLAAAVVTVLLALTCACFVRELWQASRGCMAEARQPGFAALWLISGVALLATYALQEWIEGWATPGHPATVSHALGHIGWIAPLLAIGLAALIALALRGSRRTVVFLARRHLPRRAPKTARGRWTPVPAVVAPRLAMLAGTRAGRAPPAVSFS